MNYRDYGALSMTVGLSILSGFALAFVTVALTWQRMATDIFITSLLSIVFLFGTLLTVVSFYYYRKSRIPLTTRPMS